MPVFHESVLLLIMNFIITLSKLVAMDLQGDRRVDQQTILTGAYGPFKRESVKGPWKSSHQFSISSKYWVLQNFAPLTSKFPVKNASVLSILAISETMKRLLLQF